MFPFRRRLLNSCGRNSSEAPKVLKKFYLSEQASWQFSFMSKKKDLNGMPNRVVQI
jgi:hypothetical protein